MVNIAKGTTEGRNCPFVGEYRRFLVTIVRSLSTGVLSDSRMDFAVLLLTSAIKIVRLEPESIGDKLRACFL